MSQLSIGEASAGSYAPLADRMRPRTLDEVVGQPHLTGPRALLRRSLQQGRPYSFVLHGPPGTGKTTIAMAAAREMGLAFEQLNAVGDGVKEFRLVIGRAEQRRSVGERTLLFIDEIARWNKAQQDALLPWVENGTITLIGATTENPGFELNRALRSRLKIEPVRPLGDEDLRRVLQAALDDPHRGLGLPQDAASFTVTDAAADVLLSHADGDARALLTALEFAAALADQDGVIDADHVRDAAGARPGPGREAHYDLASALIKSVRGSDPDAAVYWLARMEAAGEEPRFVARRLLISSSEDVGMGAPGALAVAQSGFDAVHSLGAPECWIVLAEVACYLATCPKSWASYQALGHARELVREHGALPVPARLRNPTDPVSRADGAGKGYVHASQPGAHRMRFMPDDLDGVAVYRDKLSGTEQHRGWPPPQAR